MGSGGIGHVLVHDLMNSPGNLFHVQTEALSESGQGLARAVQFERHPATQEKFRIKITEYQISVSHRRLPTTAVITDRARFGARAFWADFQQAHGIYARDAPAAGADLNHVDHRDAHRQPASLSESVHAIDFELMGLQRLAIIDHTQLRRGPTHIKGEKVTMA